MKEIGRRIRLYWTGQDEPLSFLIARRLFLGLLGFTYLIAFVSLWSQLDGLIGDDGILPATRFLEALKNHYGDARWWRAPTLSWFNESAHFLHVLCAMGVVASVVLIAGYIPLPALIVLWACYLSLATAGQVFLGYQWDNLLLETGFLAMFLGPAFRPCRFLSGPRVRFFAVFLLWVLLFKLMFSSGIVKIMSNDAVWRDLTALTYHYETQPIPNRLAWYAHQQPLLMQKLSCGIMFVIEIVVPFLIFGPRRWRYAAGLLLAGLQVLIAATGNYTFFNLISFALCIPLFDDSFWVRAWYRQRDTGIPAGESHRLEACATLKTSASSFPIRTWGWRLLYPLFALILFIHAIQLCGALRVRIEWPDWVGTVYSSIHPFRSINSYGLFAHMTTTRPEIIVEGSHDGREWRAYGFIWKPGDPRRPPSLVAPYQPRLDWQMWFAALGNYQGNPWFMNFLVRLLQGAPDVLALLDHNPFPDRPPRYIRAVVHDYRFTSIAQRREQGTWWNTRPERLYCPVLTSNPDVTGP